jgi:hypothetical protein
MNFSHSMFYKLDEGSGSTVSDALGHGPVGTIAGTLTNVWANAGGLTISNAQGSSGDNAIKLQSAYIDAMCDLSTLEDNSLVMMFWFKQPIPVSSGVPFLLTYGQILKAANPDGGWGIAADNAFTFYWEKLGGTGYLSRGNGCIEPLATGSITETNNVWHAYCVQIDRFDGKCNVSGCMGGRPQRGARLFNLEADGYPKQDTSAAGLRLLAAATGVSSSGGGVWGQTQIKRIFIGRTNGEQRNNIPKWANQFYLNDTGTPDWMVS